jgi:hypothetical protein
LVGSYLFDCEHFALASVAFARPVRDYVDEICDFWEGVCEPIIHYLTYVNLHEALSLAPLLLKR